MTDPLYASPRVCYCGYVANNREEAHRHLVMNHPMAVARALE